MATGIPKEPVVDGGCEVSSGVVATGLNGRKQFVNSSNQAVFFSRCEQRQIARLAIQRLDVSANGDC